MIREAGQVQNSLGSSPFLSLEKNMIFWKVTTGLQVLLLEPGTREPLLEKI